MIPGPMAWYIVLQFSDRLVFVLVDLSIGVCIARRASEEAFFPGHAWLSLNLNSIICD